MSDYTAKHIDDMEAGQEEVYVPLQGSGWIEIDGERVDLNPNVFVRVGPAAKRKVYSGEDGLSMLALGGVPGESYEINPVTELEGSASA